MAQSMRRAVSAPAPAPVRSRIERGIERGRNGAKFAAVYCNGWAV
jgi:hypothetical protein